MYGISGRLSLAWGTGIAGFLPCDCRRVWSRFQTRLRFYSFFIFITLLLLLVQSHYGIRSRRYLYEVGPGWRSRYTDRYGLERPGFETQWLRDILLFSIPLHTGLGAHHPPLQRVPDMALPPPPHLEYSQPYLCSRSSSRCLKWGDLQSIPPSLQYPTSRIDHAESSILNCM